MRPGKSFLMTSVGNIAQSWDTPLTAMVNTVFRLPYERGSQNDHHQPRDGPAEARSGPG